METKLVLKLDIRDEKEKQKAMTIVSGLAGVNSVSMDVKRKMLTVTGTMDPIGVVNRLRKFWNTEIVKVEPAKDPKEEEKKKEEKKEERKRGERKKEGGKKKRAKEEEEDKKKEPKKEEAKKEEKKKEPAKKEEKKKEPAKKEEKKEPAKKEEKKKKEPAKKEEKKKKEPEPTVGNVPRRLYNPLMPYRLQFSLKIFLKKFL